MMSPYGRQTDLLAHKLISNQPAILDTEPVPSLITILYRLESQLQFSTSSAHKLIHNKLTKPDPVPLLVPFNISFRLESRPRVFNVILK